MIKAKGKIVELAKLAAAETLARGIPAAAVVTAHAGIAHTRWATHGPPCARNSHPHVSSAAHEFVVVHNGTITNYRALKEFLTKEGEVFESDTDTEVIPKLCRFLYSRLPEPIPFPALVCEVVKQLEGAYALLIKSAVYPGELVACRRGSPLILGMKYGIQVRWLLVVVGVVGWFWVVWGGWVALMYLVCLPVACLGAAWARGARAPSLCRPRPRPRPRLARRRRRAAPAPAPRPSARRLNPRSPKPAPSTHRPRRPSRRARPPRRRRRRRRSRPR